MTDNLPAISNPSSPAGNRLEELAQAHEVEALSLQVEVMRDKDAKPEHRLRAAEVIMDRARGKPRVNAPATRDPRKAKAVSMSINALLAIVSKAQARVQHSDAIQAQAKILEAEFTPSPKRRPVNEYRDPPATPADDLDDLLS